MEDPLPRQLKASRGRIGSAIAVLFAHAVLIVAVPWPLKFFFDRVIDGSASHATPEWMAELASAISLDVTTTETVSLGAIFIVLALGLALVARWEEMATLRAALDVGTNLRRELLQGLFRGKLDFFEQRSPSDLAERVCDDTAVLSSLVSASLKAGARAVPTLILVALSLFLIDSRFPILFGLMLIPFCLFVVSLGRRSSVHNRRAAREADHFREELVKALSRLPGVKSFALESSTLEELDERSYRVNDHLEVSRRARGSMRASVEGAKNLVRAAVAIVGGLAYANGTISSAGTLILFFAYVEIVAQPVIEIGRFVAKLRSSDAARERIKDLLVQLEETEETEGAQDTSSLPFFDAGVLHFENVAFSGAAATETFDAEFEPGELVAVVGSPFTGKTTFGRSLNRLSDLQTGKISLGRNDLKRFTLRLLRETITLVDRVPFFLHTSVRENLLLTTDSDERAVGEALSAAGVDFLSELPEKLDTIIGQGAYELNDSQSRRLHLARAFLRTDARVFYFDEPTLDLPADEAREIYESLRILTERGAIVFWVTRRLDEAAEADRVVFLARGRKPLIDSHETLLLRDEAYRRLFGLKGSKTAPAEGEDAFSQAQRPEQSI